MIHRFSGHILFANDSPREIAEWIDGDIKLRRRVSALLQSSEIIFSQRKLFLTFFHSRFFLCRATSCNFNILVLSAQAKTIRLSSSVDRESDGRTTSSCGLSVVLHFAGGEAWRVRCSSRFRGGVHLVLANLPWRQLQERAEKIPGDKKHVEGMLSQDHCVAQFDTAHEFPGSGPQSPGKSGYRTSSIAKNMRGPSTPFPRNTVGRNRCGIMFP